MLYNATPNKSLPGRLCRVALDFDPALSPQGTTFIFDDQPAGTTVAQIAAKVDAAKDVPDVEVGVFQSVTEGFIPNVQELDALDKIVTADEPYIDAMLPTNAAINARLRAENDAKRPYLDLCDFVAVRVYVAFGTSPDNIRRLAKSAIDEGYRIARGKPVVAVASSYYAAAVDGKWLPLTDADMRTLADAITANGVTRVVNWSSTGDEHAGAMARVLGAKK